MKPNRRIALHNIGEREAAAREVRARIESAAQAEPSTLGLGAQHLTFDAAWLFELGLLEEGDQYLASIEARVNRYEPAGHMYKLLRSYQEYALGNFDSAIDYTEDFLALNTGFLARRQKARACIAAERWNDAIAVLELMDSSYYDDRSRFGLLAARLHYNLGVAYQAKGRSKDAIDQFERLLSIWDQADPRLKDLDDAKQRLALLKQGS